MYGPMLYFPILLCLMVSLVKMVEFLNFLYNIMPIVSRAEQADLKILMADCCTLQEKLISSEFCSKSLTEFARVVLNNTHTLKYVLYVHVCMMYVSIYLR